jgi:hypothetical protein
VAYRKLEVNDRVKIRDVSNPLAHGCFGVVKEVISDARVLVEYHSWYNHRHHDMYEVFGQGNLMLSANQNYEVGIRSDVFHHDDEPDFEVDFSDDNEELYKGNLLERIVKLEQEIVDLKKRLA